MAFVWWNVIFMVCVVAQLEVISSTTTIRQPALSELLRYFPDESLYFKKFACSNQERVCFDKMELLYEADGQCYKVGQRGPCPAGKTFHADLQEAKRLGGHLRGTCESACQDDSQAPFIATRECMTRSQVENQYCRSEWYLEVAPEKDIYGQWVCEWTHLPCPPPNDPPQSLQRMIGGSLTDSGFFAINGTCAHPNVYSPVRPYNYTAPINAVSPDTPANHPLLEVFVNSTYVGREIPCTEGEKECMRYNRVMFSDGKCYMNRKYEYRLQCRIHVDYEAIITTGTLRIFCGDNDRDSSTPTPHIDDPALWAHRVCRFEWGMKSSAVGGVEFGGKSCQCTYNSPPPPMPVTSDPRPGFCRVPDFDYPVGPPVFDLTLAVGFSLPCSAEEHACLRNGRVLAQGACHALRTQGPCADGEELVLDKLALRHSRLQGVCKPRPCPEGSVLLPFDGRCLTHQQVASTLCPGQAVALDEFGGWQCLDNARVPGNLSATIRHASNSTCVLPHDPEFLDAVRISL